MVNRPDSVNPAVIQLNTFAAMILDPSKVLDDFRFVDPTWSGNGYLRFWDETTVIDLVPQDDGTFRSHQLLTLEKLLSFEHDLRPEFERQMFEFYTEDVFECSQYLDADGNDITELHAPRIRNGSEIWPLIELGSVRIDLFDGNDDLVGFQMLFNCKWDEEHGLGVHYRDWEIHDIGGWVF